MSTHRTALNRGLRLCSPAANAASGDRRRGPYRLLLAVAADTRQ